MSTPSVASGLPLFRQISVILRSRILNGTYLPGTFFPTEAELCREFSASRVTVRQAVMELASEGLLVRQRGRGTTVTEGAARRDAAFTGYLEDLMTFFTATKILDLRLQKEQAPEAVRDFLGTGGEPVVRIERVRTLDERPFAVTWAYLPLHLGQQVGPDDLMLGGMLETLERRCGVLVGRADQTIAARLPDPETAHKLGIKKDDPVLFVELRYSDVDGVPVAFTQIAFRGDRYQYRARLGRIRGWSRGGERAKPADAISGVADRDLFQISRSATESST